MQPLSPKKYIETRVRTLPISKCYVNKGWQQAGLANVLVFRRHVNNHVSGAVYLVDLKCLGVKDTMWFFNEDEEEMLEKYGAGDLDFETIDYEVAHNIVYAGHDFAMEYDIHPEKEFATSRFVLEEDDDSIPLVEIAVGEGPDAKPHLIEHTTGQYADALAKLKKHAGDGNYYYTTLLGEETGEEDDDDDSFLDEEDWDDEPESLKDLEPGQLDFATVNGIPTEELEDPLLVATRSEQEQHICKAELHLRKYRELQEEEHEDDLEDESLNEDERSTETGIIEEDGWSAQAGSRPFIDGTTEEGYEAGIAGFKAYYAAITNPGLSPIQQLEILKNQLPQIAHNLYFLMLAFERIAVAPYPEQTALLLPLMEQHVEKPVIRLAMAFYQYEQKITDPISDKLLNTLTPQQAFPFSDWFADDELAQYFALQTIRHCRAGNIENAIANYELLTESLGAEMHVDLLHVMFEAFLPVLEKFVLEKK